MCPLPLPLLYSFYSTFYFTLTQPQNPSSSPTSAQSIMDSPSQPNRSTSPSQQPNINGHDRRTFSGLGSSNFIGKHRLAAIISQQNLQIQAIQEELDQLETLGESSLVCEQLISSVESSTDALLPVTRGPADGGWDRWFQRASQSSSRNRKRWI
ncbi:hypothetical protein SSX86_029430 [Deinandra increscens subsp. villosa]|uniref:G protein gamma domain-containing protein n=1 Tax=Deinandra increscens subsp. villosa TaxID=3103831 RepID=A0AAP0GMC3_9ASTR